MNIKDKRVLVTGGAGFMGSWLVDRLIESGCSFVYVVDDFSGGFKTNINPKSNFIRLDLADAIKTEEVVNSIKPQIIFHLAASAREGASAFQPRYITQTNYQAFINLVTPAIKNGLEYFCAFSTMAVYGKQTPPFDESMPRSPVDIYGINKASMEHSLEILSKIHDFKYSIIRPHNVLGPRQCLPKGSLVVSQKGLIPIENLVPGDFIINRDGESKKVNVTMNLGPRKSIILRYDNGSKSSGGADNHRILTVMSDGTYDWKYLKDVKENDWVLRPKIEFNKKFHIEELERGELLGLLVGDGSYCQKYKMAMAVKPKKSREYFIYLLKKYFPKVHYWTNRKDTICWASCEVREVFEKEFGLLHSKRTKKTIPNSVFNRSFDFQIGFLRGLFSSDGCVSEVKQRNTTSMKLSFVNTSKQVSDFVYYFLNSIGIDARQYLEHRENRNHNDLYQVLIPRISQVRKFLKYVGFCYPEKTEKAKFLLEKHKNKAQHEDIIPFFYEAVEPILSKLKWDHPEKRSLVEGARKGVHTRRTLAEKFLNCLPDEQKKTKDYKKAKKLLDYSYLRVISTEYSEDWMYDLECEGHEYVGLGIVNHNCLVDRFRNCGAIFMNRIMREEPIIIYGDGLQKRAFSGIEYSLNCYIRVLEYNGEIFNIGGKYPVTVLELAYTVIDAMGLRNYKIVHLPDRPLEVKNAWCTYQKSEELLGYSEPKDGWKKTIYEMAEWAKTMGPKDWNDHEQLEIVNDLTPKTWLNGFNPKDLVCLV